MEVIGLLFVTVMVVYTLIVFAGLWIAIDFLATKRDRKVPLMLGRKSFESRDSSTSELEGFESSAVMDEEDE